MSIICSRLLELLCVKSFLTREHYFIYVGMFPNIVCISPHYTLFIKHECVFISRFCFVATMYRSFALTVNGCNITHTNTKHSLFMHLYCHQYTSPPSNR